jgi:hypothetical protein
MWFTMFDKAFWPVRPEDFKIDAPPFHNIMGASHDLPEFISTMTLNHPGSSQAYRIHHELGDIVIATDHEPGNPDIDAAYAKFVSGAKFLVADIQYSAKEYLGEVGIDKGPAMPRKNWGHATPEMLFGYIRTCEKQPENILVTHHDPSRNGYDLAAFGETIERAAAAYGITSTVCMAEDGVIF